MPREFLTDVDLKAGAAIPLGSAAAPGMWFSGDTNTGLYSPGADQVGITTGGTERMRIDSAGNTGVGTSSAAYKLHVRTDVASATNWIASQNATASGGNGAGFIGIADVGTKYFLLYENAGGETIFTNASNGPIVIGTNNTERMRIDSSGRVLVGTSSNSGGSLLQVNDNRIRVATAKTPASATDTGAQGEICWDASYIYVCTATNTWKRAALSTW